MIGPNSSMQNVCCDTCFFGRCYTEGRYNCHRFPKQEQHEGDYWCGEWVCRGPYPGANQESSGGEPNSD